MSELMVSMSVLALYAACAGMTFSRYRVLLLQEEVPVALRPSVALGLWLVDRFGLHERLTGLMSMLEHKLLLLQGRSRSAYAAKLILAKLTAWVSGGATVGSLGCLYMDNTWAAVLLGIAICIVAPLLDLRRLDEAIRLKRRHIVQQLPEVLDMIVLLVQAGESVQMAWVRSSGQAGRSSGSFLQREMERSVRELAMNVPFAKVLEDLNSRCAMQEVAMFTSAILFNQKRGGGEFVIALQALSRELWQRRKASARQLGEEASAKLVFPMALIFFAVMLVVAAPALLMMKS